MPTSCLIPAWYIPITLKEVFNHAIHLQGIVLLVLSLIIQTEEEYLACLDK